MTLKTDLKAPAPDWRASQRQILKRPAQLSALAQAAPDPAMAQAHDLFAVRVPPEFASLIDWSNPADPLLRQVWPAGEETLDTTGFGDDPVGEIDFRHAGGIVHRYANRALIITTGACAINCRYCFRRHFPYAESVQRDWQQAVDYIAARPGISEVILSGGDPLVLATERLADLTARLSHISHLRRLRIHSRMPLVAPERIDAPLLQWLESLPWPATLVTHCNHARELGEAGAHALRQLAATGLTLLNQSVLLAGVNDDETVLGALSEHLFDRGVLPYYLHQLDRVAGAAHFAVSDERALILHGLLRERLPGYLVPRLVRDLPGALAKQPL